MARGSDEQANHRGPAVDTRAASREGNVKAAVEVYRRTQKDMAGWSVPEADLVKLIVGLRKAGLYGDAVPLMVDYLARYSTNATAMRIALAEALVREQRPASNQGARKAR